MGCKKKLRLEGESLIEAENTEHPLCGIFRGGLILLFQSEPKRIELKIQRFVNDFVRDFCKFAT
jgi:hypothetical protein